jgi:death-on-curing protein
VFLGLNGRAIEAPEGEVVTVMLALAGGELDEAGFAEWLRSRLVGRAKGESG